MTPRPKSKQPTKDSVVTVRLDPTLRGQMEALRVKDGMPFAEQIRRALEAFLEGKKVRPKPVAAKDAARIGRARIERLL